MYGSINESFESVVEDAISEMDQLLDEGAVRDQISEAASRHYTRLLKRYQPIIDSLPVVLPLVGREIAKLGAGFVGIANAIHEDEDFRQMMKQYRRNRASAVHDNFVAYREAGFGRIAAFVLTVADSVKNPFKNLGNGSRSNNGSEKNNERRGYEY